MCLADPTGGAIRSPTFKVMARKNGNRAAVQEDMLSGDVLKRTGNYMHACCNVL